MIKLKKYNHTYFDLINYELEENQAKFTVSIDYCINRRKDLEDPDKQIILIFYDNYPVGFFVLDMGNEKFKLTNNKSSILIRSLSVNPLFQGKGIGQKAMTYVTEYVKENYPFVNEMALSVNLNNKTAYKIYLKSGFVDTGKIIHGIIGGQNVLTKTI